MNSINSDSGNIDLGKWFHRKGFEKIEFKGEKEYLSTHWVDEPINFKLIQAEGFDTFIKDAFGGSILVFECKIEDDKVNYNCYSPIWIFGVWSIKLKFKKKGTYFFKYLKEGYKLKEEFDHYINKKRSAKANQT